MNTITVTTPSWNERLSRVKGLSIWAADSYSNTLRTKARNSLEMYAYSNPHALQEIESYIIPPGKPSNFANKETKIFNSTNPESDYPDPQLSGSVWPFG